MLKILLNVGVGLSVLLSGGLRALDTIRSEGALPGPLQQPHELQPSRVALHAEQRTQLQAAAGPTLHQSLLRTQDEAQVRQRDQPGTATQKQLHRQDQLRITNRSQLARQANSRFNVSAGQGWNQP